MDKDLEIKLLNVNPLEIYNDIAAIKFSQEQQIQLCFAFTCSVDLRRGNIIYSVEKRYKDKLATYNTSKRLKWFNVNLKIIVPNPEEKYLKWKEMHNKSKHLKWLSRKIDCLDYFTKQALLISTQDPLSQSPPPDARATQSSNHSRKARKRKSNSEISNRSVLRLRQDSLSSSLGNNSSDSVQTVIASQPKQVPDELSQANLMELFEGVIGSHSSIGTDELPPLCTEGGVSIELVDKTRNAIIATALRSPKEKKQRMLTLLQRLDAISSQEDAYDSFHQDMQVTSTQEFG